ncbi:MAG TPA: hypothetical protein VI755_15090 [Anaerolineales bacterium]|nr:hypothetical protein [Anaerolineales bacterium]
MAGMAVLVLAPLIYGIIALNTGDLLWVSPVFSAEPGAIVIHCYSNDVPLEPGTSDFVALTDLVNETLSGSKRWDPLSLSEVTYQDYRNSPQMMTLELFYASPLRVHSRYKFFSNVDAIIIPLEGRHALTMAVFGRRGNLPAAGSFHVDTTAPLVEYLAEQGLCDKP